MNVQEAIADFLQHGQAVRNLSDRTIRAYQSDLTQFHVHVNDTSMVDITPEHLEEYLDKLGTGPYRDTSIRRWLRSRSTSAYRRARSRRASTRDGRERRLGVVATTVLRTDAGSAADGQRRPKSTTPPHAPPEHP